MTRASLRFKKSEFLDKSSIFHRSFSDQSETLFLIDCCLTLVRESLFLKKSPYMMKLWNINDIKYKRKIRNTWQPLNHHIPWHGPRTYHFPDLWRSEHTVQPSHCCTLSLRWPSCSGLQPKTQALREACRPETSSQSACWVPGWLLWFWG